MKRQVEIFTANCPVCDPVVKMVNELACGSCEVTTYDLTKESEEQKYLGKLKEYGVKRLPAIAVNGKLLDCCQNNAISREDLVAAGIGKE